MLSGELNIAKPVTNRVKHRDVNMHDMKMQSALLITMLRKLGKFPHNCPVKTAR